MSQRTVNFIIDFLYHLDPTESDLKYMDKFIKNYLFDYGIRGFETWMGSVNVNQLHAKTIDQIENSCRCYREHQVFLPSFLRKARKAIRIKNDITRSDQSE